MRETASTLVLFTLCYPLFMLRLGGSHIKDQNISWKTRRKKN